jgi:hypothetical protein
MTAADYKAEREKRGTHSIMLPRSSAFRGLRSRAARSECAPVSREAWIALLAIPERRERN